MVRNPVRHRAWLFFLLGGAAASFPPGVRADENIGVASVIRNDVSGILVSGTVKVSAGTSVFRNEIMKTASDSSAKLVFTDSTNLAIGPNSTVKLNHFVAAGPSSYGKATINVAKGVFRFTTGHSDKGAYELSTGVATMGVRGTVFEGVAAPTETKLHVVEGIVDVRTKKGKSCEVRAGKSVRVTDTACTPISAFDTGFSPEFTEVQEFSQVQAGEQTLFSAEDPAAYVVAGAAVAGGVAAGVAVSTSQSPPNNLTSELLLLEALKPATP